MEKKEMEKKGNGEKISIVILELANNGMHLKF